MAWETLMPLPPATEVADDSRLTPPGMRVPVNWKVASMLGLGVSVSHHGITMTCVVGVEFGRKIGRHIAVGNHDVNVGKLGELDIRFPTQLGGVAEHST